MHGDATVGGGAQPALSLPGVWRAIRFPESLEVPETQLHLLCRTILYQLLSDELGERATVCSDQFVYLDAEDPSQVLARMCVCAGEPRSLWFGRGRCGNEGRRSWPWSW